MTAPSNAIEIILQRWRASLPANFSRPYFDGFVQRHRATIEAVIGAWLAKRAARKARAPESQTASARTKRNIAAMTVVATRRPQDMTADERHTVLGYSGWGGLSIEGVMDQFPPGLVPSEFALIHEYYTPTAVAEAIADLVCPHLPELAGFDGVVRALEPTVGIGRLVRAMGPPRCLISDPSFKEIRWTAVELSEVSAKMFGAMRPDVELFESSIERWMSEHGARYQGTLGLILSNPPYGQRGEYALQDKSTEYNERAAYAYVMRRCLDLLVPRGLAVFVIPSGFLSGSQNRGLREKVLLRHHLEVAFRLPSVNTANKELFPGAGNVVDVLVWRARGGELKEIDPGDAFILDGAYFRDFPTHILGIEEDKPDRAAEKAAAAAGEKVKRSRYKVVGDFAGFPVFTARPVCRSCSIRNLPTMEVQEIESVIRDVGDEGLVVDAAGSDLRQALDLGRRVDRYLALVAANDPRAVNLWPELVEALDSLRRTATLRTHEGNPWKWPELRQLARNRPFAARLLSAYQKGGELAEGLATAPKILPKFSAQPDDVLAQAEHLYRSRRRLNVADLEAFHKSQGGVLGREGLLEQVLAGEWNLDGDEWDELVPSRAYLGGMLWPKYDQVARRTDPQALKQRRRLEAVMNLAVFEDIQDVSPRQGWVPLSLVSAWLSETLNSRYGAVDLERVGGTVQLPATGGAAGVDDAEDDGLKVYKKMGTTTALSPEALWCIGWINHDFAYFKPKLSPEAVLKLKAEDEAATGESAADFEEDHEGEGEEEKDEDENLGVVRLLLGRHWDRDFVTWLKGQDDRVGVLRDAYNRAFRGVVIPTYDGDTLEIARWNEKGPQLKAHQIAGARRVLDLRGGLIAFDVGVGKTYTAIGVVAAARQEGWVRRPVVLVPSSLVWKWADDFVCVLTDYRVLVIGSNRKTITKGKRKGFVTSESDTPEERAEKWSAFQAGLYDVVILSYDALGRTKMNHEALLSYLNTIEGLKRQIKLRQRNAQKKDADKLSERERAILKHGARAFVEEMLELPKGHKFDPGIAWDDIGIDMLVVDEAAAFKNSYKPEAREHGMPKFMGSSGDGSKRAWQLDFRAAAVRQRNGGTGVVLLTATPAKNSPLEFYNLIQLIDPYAFSKKGLMDPEQFIDRFLRIQSREIIDMTLKVRMGSCVDGFKNLDDLRMVIKTYGEFRSGAEVGLKLPEPRSEQVRVELGPAQESLYGEVVRKLERALKMAGQPGGQSQNKILGLLARLSMISLHARLDGGVEYNEALSSIDPDEYAAPKLDACAKRIAASSGCGHIIFCEPTAVHLWMREVLVHHKIPRDRIAILNAIETQSADRIRIAREFNGISTAPQAPGSCASAASQRVPPKYDVIIANSVAYEGIDLQVRTCAIHHLDLPWTPADLEQRNGRAVRQGNELPVVQIYYYLSDRSMDWYRYQLIQGKRAWLGAVLESQARDTSNPGAQDALSDEEILMMISRDPDATQKAIDARKENLAAQARLKVAREAANLLVQANARFRDARETGDAEKAARLRGEGDQRLRDLRRIDVMAWPWGRWIDRVRDVEVLVASPSSPPVFEGLRVKAKDGWAEFGRIIQGDQRRIGRRKLGSPMWDLLGEAQVAALQLQPADLDAGTAWPSAEEADLADVLDSHIRYVLGRKVATYDELEWLGASDTWLTAWWPTVAASVQAALAQSTAEDRYPIELAGVLTLAAGEALQGGVLLPPTMEGWARFLELAPQSDLKVADMRATAEVWWQRKLRLGQLRGKQADDAGADADADANEAPDADANEAPPRAPGSSSGSAHIFTAEQTEQLQALLDRERRDSTESAEEMDRRVFENIALQAMATNDALAMGGGTKADRAKATQASVQLAERITILRAVAAVLRSNGYQVALAGQAAQSFNIVGLDGKVLAAAPHSGAATKYAPRIADDVRARFDRDLAAAREAVKKIILEETQRRGPHPTEEMMLEVWRRARDLPSTTWRGAAPPTGASTERESQDRHEQAARKPKKPAKPAAPATPAAPAYPAPRWADRLVDAFNADAGPKLRLVGQTGRGQSSGLNFVVTTEDGRTDLASIHTQGHEVDEVQWLSDRVRPSEQDAIAARLDRVLQDSADLEQVAENEPAAATQLQPLIDLLERQRATTGASWVTTNQKRGSGLHGLALALSDLIPTPDSSPAEVATWLNENGLLGVASVLEDEGAVAYSNVDKIVDEVWAACDEVLPLVVVKFQGGKKFVDARALGNREGYAHKNWILIRESSPTKSRKYSLRMLRVQTSPRPNDDAFVNIDGDVASGATLYIVADLSEDNGRKSSEHGSDFIRQVHDRLTDLEHGLRRTPQLLGDVRRLLLLAGALIDTERCQGREQKDAMEAFIRAKRFHDAARRLVIMGKPAAAAEKIHQALQRIATSAALIAQSCAEGQQSMPGAGAALSVSPADAAALEQDEAAAE